MIVDRPRVGRRGEVLLFFALLDGVFAYAVFNPRRPLNPQYVWLDSVLPLWVWGTLWAVTAAIALVYAFQPRDTLAFTVCISIKVGWGLLSLFGWIAGADDRGYVSAMIWLGFAYFVFRVAGGIPGPGHEADDREQPWIH
jgi:hypothetical protein